MTATKTNERPGTKAVLRHSRMSSTKAREVLDLIRGMEYTRARDVITHLDRGAATPIGKLLHSCAANAEHNDGLDPTELYVASCFADEGTTLKRWRPRARGRATRIRKRTCHITIILAPMPSDRLARQRARAAAEQADRRARRVAGARRRATVADAPSGRGGRAKSASATDVDETSITDEVLSDAPVLESDAAATDVVETDVVETGAAETDVVDADATETDAAADDVETAIEVTGDEAAESSPVAEASDDPDADAEEGDH
jgi:large subunit ribosomal protein L22